VRGKGREKKKKEEEEKRVERVNSTILDYPSRSSSDGKRERKTFTLSLEQKKGKRKTGEKGVPLSRPHLSAKRRAFSLFASKKEKREKRLESDAETSTKKCSPALKRKSNYIRKV